MSSKLISGFISIRNCFSRANAVGSEKLGKIIFELFGTNSLWIDNKIVGVVLMRGERQRQRDKEKSKFNELKLLSEIFLQNSLMMVN